MCSDWNVCSLLWLPFVSRGPVSFSIRCSRMGQHSHLRPSVSISLRCVLAGALLFFCLCACLSPCDGHATVLPSSACPIPRWVTVHPTNNQSLYAICGGGPYSIVVSNSTGVYPITTTAQCSVAYSLAINPTNGILYAGSQNNIFQVTPDGQVSTLPTSCPAAFYGVDVNPNDGIVYAACKQTKMKSVGRAGPSTFLILDSFFLSLCVSVVSSLFFLFFFFPVPLGQTQGIFAIDGGSVTNIWAADQCNFVKVNPATNTVYATCGFNGVARIVGGTPEILFAYPSPCSWGHGAAFTADDAYVYATCMNGGAWMWHAGTSSNVVTGPCTQGNFVTQNPNTGRVYFSCTNGVVVTQADGTFPELITNSPLATCSDWGPVALHPVNAVLMPCSDDPGIGVISSKCAPGEFTSSADNCDPCAVGQYQTQADQSGCFACYPGQFAANPGQPVCTDCGAGSFSDIAGASILPLLPLMTLQLVSRVQLEDLAIKLACRSAFHASQAIAVG
jgi:hypothetical protein